MDALEGLIVASSSRKVEFKNQAIKHFKGA